MFRTVLAMVFLLSILISATGFSQPPRPRVALVLSGGGARGGAHIGVIRQLEKAGVPIDLVVGTSYGALIGGLYCAGYSTADLELLVRSVDWNKLFTDPSERTDLIFNNKARKDRQLFDIEFENWSVDLPSGLQSGQRVTQLLDRLSAAILFKAGNDFDRLTIPFRAVATDILKGQVYVFRSGSLATAIRASIAVPGYFTPVELDNALLVDGGVSNNLPVDVALEHGADLVIAVDVSTPMKGKKEEIKSLLDVLDQVVGFGIEEKTKQNRERANVVIVPNLEGFGSTGFERSHLMIAAGENAVQVKLNEIDRVLREKGISLRPATTRVSLLNPQQFNPDTYHCCGEGILVNRIEIEGLQKLSARYARDHVSARVGEPLSLAAVDDDVSRLFGTDLFKEVRLRLEKQRGDTVVAYQVREGSPTKVAFGLRYDLDFEFTAMIDLINHSFMGSQSNFFFRTFLGNWKDFVLGLNSGQVFGKDLLFSSQLHYTSLRRRIFEEHRRIGDYQDQRAGFTGSAQYLWSDFGRAEIAYQFQSVDIDRGAGVFTQDRIKALGKLNVGIQVDTLDDFDFPQKGALGGIEFEWSDPALGGNFSFNRSRVRLDHYFSPSDSGTIGLNGFWGRVSGGAPFYERFYVGGAHHISAASLRFVGLDRDQILTRHTAISGLSYRHRLKHFKLGMLRDVYLAGNYQLGFFNRNADLSKLGDPLHGTSLGLHFNTNLLGPIRFEVGGARRRDLSVYFSIGHFF